MNDFREFSKAYNDYLCHGQSTGSSVKYGSKEYVKSGRRVYGSEAANMRPKDYLAKCLRQGISTDEVIALCESAMDPRYGIGPAEKRFYSEVIRLAKSNIQHSYTNDFRDMHENYLMHFGILGMKWGVRRYQNPDGTLTAAGKNRYDKYMKKAEAEDKVVEVFKDEKPKFGSYNNVGYNAKVMASKKAEKFRKKAEKYGTETPEERKATIERHRQEAFERNKQKIEEANKIDLEDVKNKIPMKEVKDKWEKAAKQDTYDLDFLEITQNDYDEMPEDASKKQRLKDYGDYLNAQKLSNMVIDKHKKSQELDGAADLALKAMQKQGSLGDVDQYDDFVKEWITYEDQTIGNVEVADLCKKMYNEGHNKNDVLNTLKSINDNKFIEHFKNASNNKEGLWDLDWFTGSEITGKYAQEHGKPGEKYIDAIFAILESEDKIQHNNTNKIFEKFGII